MLGELFYVISFRLHLFHLSSTILWLCGTHFVQQMPLPQIWDSLIQIHCVQVKLSTGSDLASSQGYSRDLKMSGKLCIFA